MARVKKIVNDPHHIVEEVIEGFVLASHGSLRKVEGVNALMRAHVPEGKVALLIGGGSGHEPMYTAFVGENLADASVCGHIFAAPTPDIIFEATKAVHRGNGVLYVYGNYAGDIMNFDIAAEMAAAEGITVKTARVMDDVASAPPERMDQRRGIGGAFYQVKIAGAACATAPDLDAAYRIALKAQASIRSIGVAVAAGSLPETGEPTFLLGDDEIEIGMGAHGEPGVQRRKLIPADALTEEMVDLLVNDLPFRRGDRVALLLNDLGATTLMELMIVNRKARMLLDQQGIVVHETQFGSYLTCQEMAGFSLSLIRLDDELTRYVDLPATSLGYARR